MSGRNLIILIGNLGRDCETKYTKSGKAVCSFSLAVTERKGQEAEWFNIVAWDKLAETCQEHLNKGNKVYVEGRQKTESWESDGEKKYKQTVVIHQMTMLGGGVESKPQGKQRGVDFGDERMSPEEIPNQGFPEF
jgi:single-strand DNA-binding protein